MCGYEYTLIKFCDLIHADNVSHTEEYSKSNQIPNMIEWAKTQHRMFVYKLPISIKDIACNFPSPKAEDCKAYLNHARVMVFAHPNLTKDQML